MWNPNWGTTYPWARGVAGHKHKVYCSVCHNDFNCSKGEDKLRRHEKSTKHKDNTEKQIKPVGGVKMKENTIQAALKKSEAKAVEQRQVKDDALRAEAGLVAFMVNHNLPRAVIDCMAEFLPKFIHDSEIVKNMRMHRHKADYTLKFGLADHARKKMVTQMNKFPFSTNYDESVKGKSSQVTVIASYRGEDNRIKRRHLVTINIKVMMSGENLCNLVFSSLDTLKVNYVTRQISERTDGCMVMLGKHKGAHTMAKNKVPQLPDLGGCGCHDACNCLKKGVVAMNSDLVALWKATYPCLEKASMKKTLHYEELCEELGQVYRHTPKYLEVRFRYLMSLTDYLFFFLFLPITQDVLGTLFCWLSSFWRMGEHSTNTSGK